MEISKLSEIFGLDLLLHSRKQEYVYARFAAYLFFRQKGFSLQKITDLFGYKNHSSVFHGIKQMQDKLSINDPIAISCWEKLKNL